MFCCGGGADVSPHRRSCASIWAMHFVYGNSHDHVVCSRDVMLRLSNRRAIHHEVPALDEESFSAALMPRLPCQQSPIGR